MIYRPGALRQSSQKPHTADSGKADHFRTTDYEEKKHASATPKEHASSTTPEEHASSTTPEEHASSATPEEHTSTATPEEHASSTTPEEHASSATPKEHVERMAPKKTGKKQRRPEVAVYRPKLRKDNLGSTESSKPRHSNVNSEK